MEFSEEWRALWPVSSVIKASPVLGGSAANLGPLFFNPSPKTITPLFSSPSLSPSLLPPPHLSLSRFLQTFDASSSLPPSLCSAVAAAFGPNYPSISSHFAHNRLQLLHCPNNVVIAFFPVGENSDQVGYIPLKVQGSKLEAQVGDDGDFFLANKKFNHRITRISVNPFAESVFGCLGNSDLVGHLMACTMYSVHWFNVRLKQYRLDAEKPVLEYLGISAFKSCGIAHACWSPHLPEQSVVLLESGELFLFDLSSCSEINYLNAKLKGTRLRVSWNNFNNLDENIWLSCEFSWHPKILIVARSDAVFIVDFRCEEFEVSCLMTIEILGLIGSIEKDRFVAFSRAAPDGFYYCVASKHRLLFCDIRKPMTPVLQWAHDLKSPCFIDVFRLSKLRACSRDDEYRHASESGFCIIVGSFWTCEFSLFCYGPSSSVLRRSIVSKIPKLSKSLSAWEIPSDLSLSGNDCSCGSCLLREDLSKDALPAWIDWHQKKEIVMGFGILNEDLSALLFEPDSFGGFTLVRLMSSGRLELQRYCASWKLKKKFEEGQKESSFPFVDTLLSSLDDEEYKFPRRFKYVKLDYLNGYLNGNLAKMLVLNMKKHCKSHLEKESFSADFHELICEKFNTCGFIQSRSSPAPPDAFRDVSLPTSIHEVALRKLWTDLPMDLLHLAFSSYSEFLEVLVDKKEVSLEFLAIPDQPQLPPFFLRKPSHRSNKWSLKIPRGNAVVGPVLPLPVLLTLHEVHKDGSSELEEKVDRFSSERELNTQCNEVMVAASEMAVPYLGHVLQNDHAVSLAEDREEAWVDCQREKPFLLCRQAVMLDKGNSAHKDERYSTLISKLSKSRVPSGTMEMDEQELFDELCPVTLKFECMPLKPGPAELKSYKLLKRQYSKWQEGFNLYQEFFSPSKLQNHDT